MRTIEHLELLKLDIELTLRQIKPYNRLRDVDDSGNELRFNSKLNVWESVDYVPFWRTD